MSDQRPNDGASGAAESDAPPAPIQPSAADPATAGPAIEPAAERGAVRATAPGTVPVTAGPAPRDDGGLRRTLWLLIPAAVILWVGREVLAPFIVAAATAYAFTPLVDSLAERTGVRRPIVVFVGFFAAVGLLALGVALLARPLIAELQLLSSQGPGAAALLLRQLIGSDTIALGTTTISVDEIATHIQDAINGLFASPGQALGLAGKLGNVALEIVLTLIVTFYMLLDGYRFRDFAIQLFPVERRPRIAALATRIHQVLGRWLRGQLLLVLLVALVTYLILGPILHVPYSLAIALLTGVLEVIPLIGPLIATVIAATVAFSSGGVGLAVTVAVVYLVIRQIEDQVVMPVVIGRAVHLHPVVTIFAVLVGLHAFGILGGLLAVPAAAALNVTYRTLEGIEDHPEVPIEGAPEPS
jgi:predicted PurR-regulated permease PerM